MITTAEIRESAKIMTQLGDGSKLNKMMKGATFRVLQYWMNNVYHYHFNRNAYSRYKSVYTRKKAKGDPLVRSGSLFNYMKSTAKITSTSKKGKIRMLIGRPSHKYTKTSEGMRSLINYNIKKGMSIKEARISAYTSKSAPRYDSATKELFKIRVPYVNSKEIAELQNMILDECYAYYQEMLNSPKPVKKRIGKRK